MALPLSSLSLLAVPLASLVLLCGSPAAQARGCIKGAAVGAVAGHVAGHHAVVGAMAGCAVGHHLAKKQQRAARREQWQLQQAPKAAPQPPASASGAAIT